MPRNTLDNHLTGVTADQPHPESYRPDLPLLHQRASRVSVARSLAPRAPETSEAPSGGATA